MGHRAPRFCSGRALGWYRRRRPAAQPAACWSPAVASPDQSARQRDAPNEGNGIGEIVVTAQRREESLQSVPLSVVAIGAEQLRSADITTVDRLQQIAPGLRIGRSGSDPRPAMRGTFTAAIQGNNDPRFGFYIDEIYQSRTSQLSMPFVDLERVEVQKGPQGTLYGRNSFGGNIAVTTAVPRDKWDAGARCWSTAITTASWSRASSIFRSREDFAVRLAGAFEDRDGYIKNAYNPKADRRRQTSILSARQRAVEPRGARSQARSPVPRLAYWNEKDHGNGAFGSKPIGALYNSAYQVAPGGTLNLPERGADHAARRL